MQANNGNSNIHDLSFPLEHDCLEEDDVVEPTSLYYCFEKEYLNLVQKTFQFVVPRLKKIPRPKEEKIIHFTLFLFFLSMLIFLVSCHSNAAYAQNKMDNQNNYVKKEQEQFYIKRDELSIRQRETGSSSGSIWADSASPKGLVTEYKPTKTGDIVTVNIPEALQYKPESSASTPDATAGANAKAPADKGDVVTSFKFEVVAIEPGGDVFLRGTKTYISDKGEQRTVMVVAKVPRRSINNSEINASDLTEVAVNETGAMGHSDYSSTGWDKTVSQKVSGSYTDSAKQNETLFAERKDLETQKKALADQLKTLKEDTERLKKDRQRLDQERAQAKSLLDSAVIVGDAKDAGAAGKSSAPAAGAAKK